MKIQRLAVMTIVAACLAAGGCQSNKASGDDGTQARTGSSGGSKVPGNARRVAEAGNGARLIHRPLREGTVYVVEVQRGENRSGESREKNKVVYSGPVRANANVVVDPGANAVTVNDQQVKANTKLDPRGTYRLYFVQKS